VPTIKSPVFADEHGDLSIFESVEKMDAHIEAIDVENNEYEFFDADGQRLTAEVDSNTGHVKFQVDNNRPPDPEHLALLLRTYFQRLPDHLAEFRERAESAGSLAALVALRLELAMRPRRGFIERLLRRARPS
jgi:hypothetical protein